MTHVYLQIIHSQNFKKALTLIPYLDYAVVSRRVTVRKKIFFGYFISCPYSTLVSAIFLLSENH